VTTVAIPGVRRVPARREMFMHKTLKRLSPSAAMEEAQFLKLLSQAYRNAAVSENFTSY
jgi:hypothetical protein